MKNILVILAVLFVFVNFAEVKAEDSTFANAEEIKVVTENFPPYQIVENTNVVGGFATEIIMELLKETGVKAKISAYPWARAYRMALNEKNVLIYSITKTEEREPLFKWVGSIIGSSDFLWSLNERSDIKINSLDDARIYKTGVPRDDNQHNYLLQNGFDKKHLAVVSSLDQAIKMLHFKRIDLIMGPELVLAYKHKTLGLDISEITKVYDIGQQWGDLSIAFSNKTSDELVYRFQKALDKIKTNGTYNGIRQKWIK